MLGAVSTAASALAFARPALARDDQTVLLGLVVAPSKTVWDKAVERLESARAALKHFDQAIYNPAWQELERRASRPALSFSIPTAPGTTFKLLAEDLDRYAHDAQLGPHAAVVVAAWRRYVVERPIAEQAVGWQAINEQGDRIDRELVDAENDLMAMPSPHPEAFAFKVLMLHGEARDREDWSEILADEARRFLQRTVNSH
jgi:hypothetical protein